MKLLFISHEASRTGAPIVLLTFLKWLRKNTSHEIRIIMVRGGELSKEFNQCGKMFTLEKKKGRERHPVYVWITGIHPRYPQGMG